MEAAGAALAGGRSFERPPRARVGDPLFRWGLTVLAGLVLVLIAFFFVFLANKASPAFSKSGVFGFVFGNDWNPAQGIYKAFSLLVGTLITSAIALVIGVPIAVATALFLTELCPRRLRGTLTVLVELLAAVPSVVYGLWGFLFLAPKLVGFERWVSSTFSFVPWIGGGSVTAPNVFVAGLILAIMIVPIVSAISREVITTVPAASKEAALALGATRWEMIRMAVLPYSRSGIVGGSMLGLGRAIGETIAVTLVIGNAASIPQHVFNQGYTLASVVANEFGEAANDKLHSGALIAAGLVLFVVTLIINMIARWFVNRGERVKAVTAAPLAGAPA